MKKLIKIIVLTLAVFLLFSCNSKDENGTFVPPPTPDLSTPNDQYLYNNLGNSLFEKYGTATRWKWNDNFIRPSQRATPIKSEFVIPSTKLVNHLWIGPYAAIGKSGLDFITPLFPAELVYIGSYIYEDDGSRLLGFAEGGARVTLLNLNSLDFQDRDWMSDPGGGILTTVHHEFSHIVHQKYGIPVGFNKISKSYLGNNWLNIQSRDEAIKLGMVRNYATVNEFEDFCEIISHLLVVDKVDFEQDFITQEDCSKFTNPDDIANCRELNAGRVLIKKKVDLVVDFYKSKFNVNLLTVRDTLQVRLDKVLLTNKIPE
jgi:substrate import-associated zinc metallohydrolase lipoprotein